jgi:hypothetical protein
MCACVCGLFLKIMIFQWNMWATGQINLIILQTIQPITALFNYKTVLFEKNMLHVSSSKVIIMWNCYKNDSVEITNKMQLCNRIYYSTVHWRLNMFRAAYRSSSGALTVFAASGLHTHVVTGRSQVCVGTGQWLRPVTTCVCKREAASTVRAPDDERYTAQNMLSLQWTVE